MPFSPWFDDTHTFRRPTPDLPAMSVIVAGSRILLACGISGPRGRAIREATGRTRYVAEHLERYRGRVRRTGRDRGRPVEAIHEGRIRKPDPGARWPAKDLRWVRGIDRFIIGGSIGTKGAMGRLIRSEARRHLRARGLGHLVFLTFAADSDDAGLLGAYQFVKALRGC